MIVKVNFNLGYAALNYIMPKTQVPHPRIEPKTLRVACSYFITLPLRWIKPRGSKFECFADKMREIVAM